MTLNALCKVVLQDIYPCARIFVLVGLCIVSCYDLPWATPFVPIWCFAYSSQMWPNNKRTREDSNAWKIMSFNFFNPIFGASVLLKVLACCTRIAWILNFKSL